MPKRCGSKSVELVCFQRSKRQIQQAELLDPMNVADLGQEWWFSASCLMRNCFSQRRITLWISIREILR
jgi:hypothetical protein